MRRKTRFLALAGVGVVLLGSSTAWVWAQASPGNLMEVTARVTEKITGVAAIAPRTLTHKVCMHAGPIDRQALARLNSGGQCRITHYQKQGDTITFDEICTAPIAVTSHGTFHLGHGADFTGTMQARLSAGGHTVTVDTKYSGKRIGSCTYDASGKSP